KLADLALLLEAYRQWLRTEELQDADQLLELAADQLERGQPCPQVAIETAANTGGQGCSRSNGGSSLPWVQFEEIWLDGFARLTTQERRLLKTLAVRSEKVTVAFCLDAVHSQPAWHSHWFAVAQSVAELREELESIDGAQIVVTELSREKSTPQSKTRFANHELAHL